MIDISMHIAYNTNFVVGYDISDGMLPYISGIFESQHYRKRYNRAREDQIHLSWNIIDLKRV